ncbi:unnamed protein product [Caenorhabditis bovis]|uniref:Sodium/calcium exchanger membrane region domain-containing protein n=1 Tax=Caenorhabditis bovis TaxID=2654633 RepID=A0A8S1EN07_9PELO|nr:unnamed protein product [Caenorhabditis bovis]
MSTFVSFNESFCDSENCKLSKGWTRRDICEYIKCNPDACEGGGYLLWSQYVECPESTAARVILIIVGVSYMLVLFVMLSSAADDFFSPSISSIVAHLKISESVAGVTFMAFGNGAPDVFGSVASVLSSPIPKADLALGELLGGALFVTTMVVSTIVLTSPFDVEIISTFRDLTFFIIALAFLSVCFILFDHVEIWMPLIFLGLYVIYVATVIVIEILHRRRHIPRHMSSVRSRHSVAPIHRMTINNVPEIQVITNAIDKLKEHVDEKVQQQKKRPSFFVSVDDIFNGIHPHAGSFLPDTIDEGEEAEDEEFVVLHNHVFQGHEARSRAQSEAPKPRKLNNWRNFGLLIDVWEHLKPYPEYDEFLEMNIFSKVITIINVIPMLFFKLTIPLNELSWCKPLALIHCVICPLFLVFSVKVLTVSIFPGSPGIWMYALIFSAVIFTLVAVFTKLGVQPLYYKEIYSYIGFLMSISWIYLISSEVVNVVTMLGIVSRISSEVLGLTIMAWSNSIADLISDVSVVKQGYPRMALAAAIGGPLFNLLMGFGLPFTIAKLQGKYISMIINPTYRLLMLFVGISLLVTFIGIIIQRFRLTRPHSIILITVYISFVIFLILEATDVLVWN